MRDNTALLVQTFALRLSQNFGQVRGFRPDDNLLLLRNLLLAVCVDGFYAELADVEARRVHALELHHVLHHSGPP